MKQEYDRLKSNTFASWIFSELAYLLTDPNIKEEDKDKIRDTTVFFVRALKDKPLIAEEANAVVSQQKAVDLTDVPPGEYDYGPT